MGEKGREIKLYVAFGRIVENNNGEWLFELVVQLEQRHGAQPVQKPPNFVWLLNLAIELDRVNSSEGSGDHWERECQSLRRIPLPFRDQVVRAGQLHQAQQRCGLFHCGIATYPT